MAARMEVDEERGAREEKRHAGKKRPLEGDKSIDETGDSERDEKEEEGLQTTENDIDEIERVRRKIRERNLRNYKMVRTKRHLIYEAAPDI